jgi:hypothetical protein
MLYYIISYVMVYICGMGTMTWTRRARCKDCRFCVSYPKGKLNRHYCVNRDSKNKGSDVRLSDLVCDKWEP